MSKTNTNQADMGKKKSESKCGILDFFRCCCCCCCDSDDEDDVYSKPKSSTDLDDTGKSDDGKEPTSQPTPPVSELAEPNEVKSPSPNVEDDKEKNVAGPVEPNNAGNVETKPEENKSPNKDEEKKLEKVIEDQTKGKDGNQPAAASDVTKNSDQQPNNVNPPGPKEETKDGSPGKAPGAETDKKTEQGKDDSPKGTGADNGKGGAPKM